MRLKWHKAIKSSTDRALETNGAYRLPLKWELRDETGRVHATVRQQSGSFVAFVAGAHVGTKFAYHGAAKDAAYNAAKQAIAVAALPMMKSENQ